MCGRFALTATPQDVRALFGYEDTPDFPPREAIAPTEPVGVVLEEGGRRRFRLMRWGFLPSWCKDPADFPLLFNARGESAPDKPAFRNALRRRRCLVPADAFYEWDRRSPASGGRRSPFRIGRADGRTAGLAGLWETWVAPDGGEIDTAAILTTTANGLVGAIHERMPVIVEPADFAAWLRGEDGPAAEAAALRLLRPADEGVLVMAPCDPARPRPLPPRREPHPPRAAPRQARRPAADPDQGSLF